ncbi:protein RALF-like 22 [Solanum dulcamara]|uniref:protein RALF-like 22 n=1 Tax=Solanum dulcamara TaxID=45834 RepID=UPI002484F23E|nr:protein RALF-like 22 [Solanum dulcamara]
MAIRPIFVFMLLATLAFAMMAESSLSSSHFNDPVVSTLGHSTSGGFDELTTGRIGDTLFEDEEMMMPTESARRALNSRDHISYRAMAKNGIPCNRRGASYYQCTRMQKIRPYRRGCSKITRCKRR